MTSLGGTIMTSVSPELPSSDTPTSGSSPYLLEPKTLARDRVAYENYLGFKDKSGERFINIRDVIDERNGIKLNLAKDSHRLIYNLIDLPVVQRLKWIAQLSTAQHVFGLSALPGSETIRDARKAWLSRSRGARGTRSSRRESVALLWCDVRCVPLRCCVILCFAMLRCALQLALMCTALSCFAAAGLTQLTQDSTGLM